MNSKLNDTTKDKKIVLAYNVFSDDYKELKFLKLEKPVYPISISRETLEKYIKEQDGNTVDIPVYDNDKQKSEISGR